MDSSFDEIIKMTTRIKYIFPSLIFALYPTISLLLHNSEQVLFKEILSTLIIVLGLLLLLWLIIYWIVSSWSKSSIIVTVFMVLFYSYGHIINWLTVIFYKYESLQHLEFLITSNIGEFLSLLLWVLLFVLFIFLVMKSQGELNWMLGFFNIIAVVILIFVTIDWVKSLKAENQQAVESFINAWNRQLKEEFPADELDYPDENQPDIYYIILDGYAREDILQKLYDYDNSEFLLFLKDRGFYIANHSRSNYPQTISSLSSSLNFMYLDELSEQLGSNFRSLIPLRTILENNRLFQYLRTRGYLIRSVPTGFFLTETVKADIIDAPGWKVDAFQTQLLNITPLPVLSNMLGIQSAYDLHRQRLIYAFSHLVDRPVTDRPVFTFAHILLPHPPFVFDAKGQSVQPIGVFRIFDGDQYLGSQESYIQGYRQQLIFTIGKVEELVLKIQESSIRPLIIVVQGDHGPGSRLSWRNWRESFLPERMSILNAYYFPDQDYQHLYPEVTPVNTFRIILDRYFGMDYPLLADRNYFDNLGSPYLIEDITQLLNETEGLK
jgi:hypothetical protein